MAGRLECAALTSQDVIHLSFPFRLEEDVEEDGSNQQKAGRSHPCHNQPCEGGVCQGRVGGKGRVEHQRIRCQMCGEVGN